MKKFIHYAIEARSGRVFFDDQRNPLSMDFKSSHEFGYVDQNHFGEFLPWDFEYHAWDYDNEIKKRSLTKAQRKQLEQRVREYYRNMDMDADNGPYGIII